MKSNFISVWIGLCFHCKDSYSNVGPACWLWDYLKRSGASGFLLPLSGGADSASVAAIVGSMCQQVIKAIEVRLLVRSTKYSKLAYRCHPCRQNSCDDIPDCPTKFIQEGDEETKQQAQRVAQLDELPDAASLARAVLTTVYMGTVNSSNTTRQRAQALANEIGADHLDVKIDQAVDAMAKLFAFITGRTPKFKASLQALCSKNSLDEAICAVRNAD